VCLKWLLSELVRYQNRLIRECTKRDFSRCSAEGLGEMASSLDGIVAKEQRILSEADKLGAEIRVWWSASLDRLATQVEYLESIAESLHLAADPQATSLLGMAASLVATPAEVEELAVK